MSKIIALQLAFMIVLAGVTLAPSPDESTPENPESSEKSAVLKRGKARVS